MRFLERYQVVQALYDNLGDKSKIHTACGALKIHSTDDGVKVETNGGFYEGDIVVGADGVHSHVRHEMNRLRKADEGSYQEDGENTRWRSVLHG